MFKSTHAIFQEINFSEKIIILNFRKRKSREFLNWSFYTKRSFKEKNIFWNIHLIKKSFSIKSLVYQILPVQRNILLRKVLSHRRIGYMYHIYLYICVCYIINFYFTIFHFIIFYYNKLPTHSLIFYSSIISITNPIKVSFNYYLTQLKYKDLSLLLYYIIIFDHFCYLVRFRMFFFKQSFFLHISFPVLSLT